MTPFDIPITPVYQWDNATCLAACVASILGLSAERVPEVVHDLPDWFGEYNGSLISTTGHALIPIPITPTWVGVWIAVVPGSKPDVSHALVYRGDECVFDPDPNAGDIQRPAPTHGLIVMPWSGPPPRAV